MLASLIVDPRIESFQNALIEKSLPLSERVVEAFYSFPRHLFAPKYPIEQAYLDRPLLLYDKAPYLSTISQPSFVLRILDMLELAEGQRVYELGTGSGWNAALLSYLVGPTGKVITSEIIPELAKSARELLHNLDVENVEVLAQDGFEVAEEKGPFDRIIFTAGADEFPTQLFANLKDGGVMVFVRKRDHHADMLEVIKKKNGQAETKISMPCSFVSVVRSKESRQEDGTL